MRVVKKHLLLLLILVLAGGLINSTKAQTIKLLGGNTLNGAMNGVLLGGATMALQNSNDYEPVRVGLGAGTLYGIGTGIYDISQTSQGQQFYISGTFNDGTNSSILVLLDTIYGAAGGAIIASSVSLMIQEPLVGALQYGSGAGAWVGFGFGLIDAFALAEGPNFSQQGVSLKNQEISGLLTFSNASNAVKMGMISPELIKQKELSQSTLKMSYKPSLNILHIKVNL